MLFIMADFVVDNTKYVYVLFLINSANYILLSRSRIVIMFINDIFSF